MKVRNGYKTTEIGLIPEEWGIKPFSYHAQICHGKSQKDVESPNGKNPILGTGGVIGRTDSFLYDKPSVLIGRKGTIDRPMYIDKPFWTVDTLFYTKIGSNTWPKWLYYFITSIDLRKYNEASGVPSLSASTVSAIPVPLPPLPEQQKIAEILSTVDEHISETETLIEKIKILKQGMMQRLLTQGIGHTEFKDTEIGRIPVEWEVKYLGGCVKRIIGGGTPSRKVDAFYQGNIPWFTVKDLNGSFYMSDSQEHITIDAVKYSSTNLIEPNSIIISTRMGLGRGFINLKEIAINQDLKAIIPLKTISPEFMLFSYLYIGKQIEAQGSGSTVKGIRLDLLQSLLIPIPQLPEQRQIASILTTIDDQIDTYQLKLSALTHLKNGLMQQLLTGNIRTTPVDAN